MLLLRLSGKAVKLARYIQSFQRSKSHSGLLRSPADPCLTSGYISEESDDSSFSFVSLDDGQIFNDDMESDGEILPTPRSSHAVTFKGALRSRNTHILYISTPLMCWCPRSVLHVSDP